MFGVLSLVAIILVSVCEVDGQYSIVDDQLVADYSNSQFTVPPVFNSSVEILDLSNNVLTSFTFTDPMPVLDRIHLPFNELEEFPDLLQAPHLTLINVSYNKIRVIDVRLLEGLQKLSNLQLKGNQLEHFPDTAFPTHGLLMLTLNDNKLLAIPRLKAETIWMPGNRVGQVRVADLLAIPTLIKLFVVKDLNLTSIENLCTAPGAQGLNLGLEINIRQTAVACDCRLAWTKLWTAGTVKHTCNQDQPLSDLSFEDLQCKGGDGGKLWSRVDVTRFSCALPPVVEQVHVERDVSCAVRCMARPNCVVFGLAANNSCLLTADATHLDPINSTSHDDVIQWFIIDTILS